MPRKVNRTIFNNKDILNRLINLRICGFSEVSLANLFNVDRTAIIYHFKKYGIHIPNVRSSHQEKIYDIPRMVSALIPPSFEDIWQEIDGERINKGRSYKEYVALSHRKNKTK